MTSHVLASADAGFSTVLLDRPRPAGRPAAGVVGAAPTEGGAKRVLCGSHAGVRGVEMELRSEDMYVTIRGMASRSCFVGRPGARSAAVLPTDVRGGHQAGGRSRFARFAGYRAADAGPVIGREQHGDWRLWSEDEDRGTDQVAAVPEPARDTTGGPSGADRADELAAAPDASAPDASAPDADTPTAAAGRNDPEHTPHAGAADGLVAGAESSVDGLVADLDLDVLSVGEIKATLCRVARMTRQLDTVASKLAATLEKRAEAAAPPRGAGKARRKVRDEIAETNRSTTGEAGRLASRGQQLLDNPALDAASSAGDIGVRHQSTIAMILPHVPAGSRPQLERRLVDAALAEPDPVVFEKQARRLLGEMDPEALRRDERRKHGRRSLRIARRDDGGVSLNGLLYGLQAETFLTAHRAFVTHEGESEQRTDEQRDADGLVDACTAALNSGVAASQHGIRPHVLVVVEASQLAAEAGLAELGVTGPITIATLRPLLRDCSFARVIAGPDGVPIEVSEQVRTVPRGLWRALVVRDGGCRWQGCDASVSICEVAHGQQPFHDQGRLSLSNAVLLCPRHHQRFDAGGWRIVIEATDVTFVRDDTVGAVPQRPPCRGPGT